MNATLTSYRLLNENVLFIYFPCSLLKRILHQTAERHVEYRVLQSPVENTGWAVICSESHIIACFSKTDGEKDEESRYFASVLNNAAL